MSFDFLFELIALGDQSKLTGSCPNTFIVWPHSASGDSYKVWGRTRTESKVGFRIGFWIGFRIWQPQFVLEGRTFVQEARLANLFAGSVKLFRFFVLYQIVRFVFVQMEFVRVFANQNTHKAACWGRNSQNGWRDTQKLKLKKQKIFSAKANQRNLKVNSR